MSCLKIDVNAPNPDLYNFRGTIKCSDLLDFKQDIDLKQFLHRGSQLRNSKYIDAIVLYTGNHTKMVLN